MQVFPSEFSIKTYIECNGSVSDNAATSEDGRSHRPDALYDGQDTDHLLYGQDTDHLINQLSESDAKLFTIVGGIRPVKNPLLLVNKFSGKVPYYVVYPALFN